MSSLLPLHRWQQLDWRFLLPNLAPRQVRFGGTVDAQLIEALRLLDPKASPLVPGQHEVADLVLLVRPTRFDFATAVQHLRSGGWLCAQVARSTMMRPPLGLAGWRRALARAGLTYTAAFWHAPNVARSTRIVRVEDRAAVRSTLARHQTIRFGRTQQLLGLGLLRLGLLGYVVPEGTVIGQRP